MEENSRYVTPIFTDGLYHVHTCTRRESHSCQPRIAVLPVNNHVHLIQTSHRTNTHHSIQKRVRIFYINTFSVLTNHNHNTSPRKTDENYNYQHVSVNRYCSLPTRHAHNCIMGTTSFCSPVPCWPYPPPGWSKSVRVSALKWANGN